MTPAVLSWVRTRRTGSTANSLSRMTVVPLGESLVIRSFSLASTSVLGLEPLLTRSTPINGMDTRVTGTGMSRSVDRATISGDETYDFILMPFTRTLQHMYENNIGNNIMLSGDSVRSTLSLFNLYPLSTNLVPARKLGL